MKLRTRDILALGCLALTLGGCRGDRSDKPPRQFFPDMDEQERWNPQTDSQFFADSRTMRQPPANTVAFGRWSGVSDAPWAQSYNEDRTDLLGEDARVYTGKNPDGTFIERIPIPVDDALLARGHERFDIYCAVCHGLLGDGEGTVGLLWAALPANYHDPKYLPGGELGQDGLIFDRAMNGVFDVTGTQKMPGYAHALSTRDAWAIVAYIRALQLSQSAPMNDVPEPERQTLLNQLSAAPTGGEP